MKHQIICLCGSTRFKPAFEEEAKRLTLSGAIVVGPCLWDQWDGSTPQDSSTKAFLDDLHLAKIAMADLVRVVNPNGYVGESTRREVEHARALGVAVEYLHPPRSTADEFWEGDLAEVVGGPLPVGVLVGDVLRVSRVAGMGVVILWAGDHEVAMPPQSLHLRQRGER